MINEEKKITEKQRSLLFITAKKFGINSQTAKILLKEKFGVESTKELYMHQMDEALNILSRSNDKNNIEKKLEEILNRIKSIESYLYRK